MIGIDIIRKKRKTGGTGGGSVGSGISTPSGGDAQNAVHADDADHANRADEAAHAASAKELDGTSSVWNTIRTWISGATDGLKDMFLRKDQDDTTEHKLTMGEAEVKGALTVGGEATVDTVHSKGFSKGTAQGFDGTGFGIWKDANGRSNMELDNLIVRMKMIIAELEVHEMTFIGGSVVLSPCGNRIDFVKGFNKAGEDVKKEGVTDKTVSYYRCYFLANDGTREVKNEWVVGQFARCKTNNIHTGTTENYQNQDYWRLCIAVATEKETIDNKEYWWFDLSNETGTVSLTVNGATYNVEIGGVRHTTSDTGVVTTTDSEPAAGDKVIGLGHAWDTARQNAAMISADDNIGWTLYKGINDYDLSSDYIVNKFSVNETIVTTDHYTLRPYAQPSDTTTVTVMRGEYSDKKSYGHNDLVTYNGQVWICTVDMISAINGIAPSLTGEGAKYWALYTAKGADGNGIASIADKFFATDLDTVTPTVDGYNWVESIDKSGWRAECRYLWAYSITTMSDGSTTNGTPYLKAVWGEKGDKGDDGSTYDIYLSASVLKGDSTGKLNSNDSVSVTAKVVKITNGTATEVTNTDEAFFRVDETRDNGDIVYPYNGTYTNQTFKLFGEGTKTWNFYLHVGGKFLKTVTLPVIRDGAPGTSTPGTPATVYTIEPCANFEATGKLTDASHVTVSISGDVQVYKTIGDVKTLCGTRDGVYAEYFRLSIGGNNYDGTDAFTYDGGNIKVSKNIPYEVGKDTNNVPGSATITLYDLISGGTVGNQLASLVVPVSLNPGAIVDVNSELGTIQNTTSSMQNDVNGMKGTIETIKQGQGQISLKVQDLQNGGIDTGKPHTSSQVDFTTLSSDNFYPVMIKFKNDDGVRHTVEIDRPLNAAYGSGKGYMTHGQGFSFRLVFSDIANAWGSYEDGQLRIESISQRCTTPDDTPICPRIAQYYPFSFIVAWLRGGSKYDVTVDCTDAYISGIWPYMMQVASNPSWAPDAVRLAKGTWTTAQINAQAGNPYNLLKKDGGGFYADVTNDYLYRFGSLSAGHTFAIVGQPTDSKQWFMATWHITNVSGSKIYVDVSTYGLLWQAQNPLGISMNGMLGYIKTGASYAKSIWDSQDGFGSSESIDNTAVHANWLTVRAILVIGTESGTGRDRAVLESVNSCSEGSSVSLFSGTYFDISPLYGTDGRANVKTDMLATGIDIYSHKIIATTDNFTVRNNSGDQTFSIDKDGNIVGEGDAYFKGTITGSTINGGTINGSTINSKNGPSTTTIAGGQITTNNISATGGNISFFRFYGAGMYSGKIEEDGRIYSGLGMSMNNLSVSGNNNRRISSVFLGNGRIDSRYTNHYNYIVPRLGNPNLGNTFYNYIKLERIGSGYFSYENSPEHAALGIETQGDFCLTAGGGPSQFAGMCFASNSGSTFTGDKQHTFYLCSGGTFTMPSDPPDGMLIVVIHTGSDITFNGNGKQFRFGKNYRDTAKSVYNGEWALFYYDGSYWNAVMMNVNPW